MTEATDKTPAAPGATPVEIRLLRPLLALLPPLVALVLQWALWGLIHPYVWVLFYPAVFVSSWIGGRRVGLIATVISTAMAWWFFVPPQHSVVKATAQFFPAGVFFTMGVLFCVFHDRLRKANQKNAEALAASERANERAREFDDIKIFRDIVSIAADAIVSVDEEQRIVLYNEGAEEIFGWSREEAIGMPLEALLPTRFREIHRQHIRNFAGSDVKARRMGEVRPMIVGLRKNAEEFPAQAAISKLRVGNAWLFTVILRDVTAHKRVEHLAEVGSVLSNTLEYQETVTSIARLVVRELADWCFVDLVEETGQVRRVEVASADPAKSDIAAALKRVPLDPNRPHMSWTVIQSKQPQVMSDVSPEIIWAVTQSEDHRRLIEAAGARSAIGVPLIAHGRLLGALIAASSRPERRLGPADLRLLEEVGRRAALALDSAQLYRRVTRAVQERDDVLGIVAHDLRNPLGAILMQAALLRGPGPEPEPRARRAAEAIERAATRMSCLIQDLLDVARMEAGRLVVEQDRVSARQALLDSVEAEQPLASQAALELVLDAAPDLPEVWADRDRLLQVFENLIGNAVKFTAPGGRITIGAAPRAGEVLFWVADTGAGIPAEELPHVFDRFWQARKAERRGAGLGLPIVRGIVEAHGGRVWAESTLGRGSTFFFTIPTAAGAEEWRPEPAPHGP